MSDSTIGASLDRLQQRALVIGGGAAALLLIGFFVDRERFFQAYLTAFLFCLGFPLGSLAFVMLHHLTGGSWGFAIRRLLEASTRTLPLVFVYFLPILAFGLGPLYEWTHADVLAHDELLQHKRPYLNTPFFLVRALLYFGVWFTLQQLLSRLTAKMDRMPSEDLAYKMRVVSAPGLGLYALTMTFAAFDWAMSLEPHWFSTLYGVLFIVGQGLSTLCLAALMAALLKRHEPFSRWIGGGHFQDVGNLMFAFVLLWAYMGFSQFLIIWSGNLAEEAPWYLARLHHGWGRLAILLLVCHFALPFFILLFRGVKRRGQVLAKVALGLLCMRVLEILWLIKPAFRPDGFAISWMDVLAPVALFGLWLAFFVRQLRGRPLVSLQDAQLQSALEEAPSHP